MPAKNAGLLVLSVTSQFHGERNRDGSSAGLTLREHSVIRLSLPLQQVPLLRDDQHCAGLILANVVKADLNGQFERAHPIESAPSALVKNYPLCCAQHNR